MRDEIETILQTDVDEYREELEHMPLSGALAKVMNLLDTVESLQKSLPDDLEERREAAAEFLGQPLDEKAGHKFEGFAVWCRENEFVDVFHDDSAEWCAWKRLLGIHAADFSAESEYYPQEPDYPEQWLEHMSEGSAGWLYRHLKDHGFHYASRSRKDPPSPPDELVKNGFISMDVLDNSESDFEVRDCPLKAPFLTGGLELPDCIDEEQL